MGWGVEKKSEQVLKVGDKIKLIKYIDQMPDRETRVLRVHKIEHYVDSGEKLVSLELGENRDDNEQQLGELSTSQGPVQEESQADDRETDGSRNDQKTSG